MAKNKGLMRVLKVMAYKDHQMYIRMIGKDVFIWDVIHENQLFSSYIVMKPGKGRQRLTNRELDEVVKMCFAGGAATIDSLLGVTLSDTDAAVVAQFEAARSKVAPETLN